MYTNQKMWFLGGGEKLSMIVDIHCTGLFRTLNLFSFFYMSGKYPPLHPLLANSFKKKKKNEEEEEEEPYQSKIPWTQ